MKRHKSTTRHNHLRVFSVIGLALIFCALIAQRVNAAEGRDTLESNFADPPSSARPWTYWFWINGNITKEGITADLEAFKRVGIGGVLWMEVSGYRWAPDGPVVPLSPSWHDAMQWAIEECDRLGLQFDLTLDFGYGSGGPHITPERSMQELLWSETIIQGGRAVDIELERPSHSEEARSKAREFVTTWLHTGESIPETVRRAIDDSAGYRDVAVLAIRLPRSAQARKYRIADLDAKSGLLFRSVRPGNGQSLPPGAVTAVKEVVDLTNFLDQDDRLHWKAPPGDWLVVRYGRDSNLKTTRPSPTAAVGLECNRLEKIGIDTHYNALLKKIIEDAGASAGKALTFAHIDSWEAGCQNWTASMPEEFRRRRGYDLLPWLPVLTGRVIGSKEMSERFLWDLRLTASEMICDNYAARLRDLVRPHGMGLSIEAYGHVNVDNLSYAGVGDMPISEFWARGEDPFPTLPPTAGYPHSSKVMASAAHVYGSPVVGAEAFTSPRAHRDHPYLLKAMGDWAFCQGVNRMIFHLSAHQAYDNMIPGLTHSRWGEFFDRHNTWFEYSKPWMDYLSRCQHLLQQGRFVADVCYWLGEGSPLNVNGREDPLEMPPGYDYDLCSTEQVLRLEVKEGRLVLPSGASYRYLLLPGTDRMTVPMARKIKELADAGARLIGNSRPVGSPSLMGYPQNDTEIETIASAVWDSGRVTLGKKLADVFREDGLTPDFAGEGLRYYHRIAKETDLYFVSHPEETPKDVQCTFRVSGKIPELWDPETGARFTLSEFQETDGSITVPLHFEPMQSWFIVFRRPNGPNAPKGEMRFEAPRMLRPIKGPWQVAFDPRWGGPREPVTFDALSDWSQHADARVYHYSGTAGYCKTIKLTEVDLPDDGRRLLLDLGNVQVMARVTLNGIDCGITWKPPYRLDITEAARPGRNELEIDVVNLWTNRMIGDEQLPMDSQWKDQFTLLQWPDWFLEGKPSPTGRYTFTSARHYEKNTPLVPSGLLGPVRLITRDRD
ncbi:MAG: hypothetical protein GY878_06820 [Fuerstiella sp.]|nr:hypothetical protein [Fuerstiella sp.]